MGILRTDKISGLETPTPVTGSVSFDGTGDYLATEVSNDFALGTNDFTFEMWVYYDNKNNGDTPAVLDSTTTTYAPLIGYIENAAATNGHAVVYISANGSSWGIASAKTFGFINEKQWYHLAISRSGSNFYLFKDGQLTDSFTSSSAIHQGANQIGFGRIQSNTYFDGYISNARVIKGTALYTSEFTPPVHELEVIGDTVLLCCNNPDSAGAEGTGKTITVNGDAAASTFSPSLTRDFTGGTEFRGVTTFDTQGYFVPPSGTTTDRDGCGTRGLFIGGFTPSPSSSNIIDYITVASMGNAQDFGDCTINAYTSDSCSSHTRAVTASGFTPTILDETQFVTIATTGNSIAFGELSTTRYYVGALSSSTRGIWGGGSPADSDVIDYVTIASIGDAIDFGNLTVARTNPGGCSSPTRGIFYAGQTSPTVQDIIDYITIATTGNATDFGNAIQAKSGVGACSNSTRAVAAGGFQPSNLTEIDYITIASTGNAQDFGDLNQNRQALGATASPTRGVFGGGYAPGFRDEIEYVQIMSTGNAKDFGDLTAARDSLGATSNGHGGLS